MAEVTCLQERKLTPNVLLWPYRGCCETALTVDCQRGYLTLHIPVEQDVLPSDECVLFDDILLLIQLAEETFCHRLVNSLFVEAHDASELLL